MRLASHQFAFLWIILILLQTSCQAASQSDSPTGADIPTLKEFWTGDAEWVLEVSDTGLPEGESDTIYMGNGIYWSWTHASSESAGVRDSCGDPVAFPGCVVRWESRDSGQTFSLAEPTCTFICDTCPCDAEDRTWQQQYPRAVRVPDGAFTMVFEHGAQVLITTSPDGLRWDHPNAIRDTGVWTLPEAPCSDVYRVNPHPYYVIGEDCMAGGPPGLMISEGKLYVFIGLGQNPGYMGCTWIWYGANINAFQRCINNPLFGGASDYGWAELSGRDANSYFDFRYVTSADVVKQDGVYYMVYEGIRGPDSLDAGRDNQFALGMARAVQIDGPWEKYPGNPILGDVADNWGVGHADLLIVDGQAILYTATPDLERGRYILAWKK